MKKAELTLIDWLGKDNTIGHDIWEKKYRQNNETFEQWLDRVSGGNEDVRRLMVEKKFLFGGRILSNRGLHKDGKKITYSNCYVIEPPEDNIESIFDTAKKLARTFSYGGGCGIDVSKLSPRGAMVNNTAKETTGAVSFMSLYNLVTDLIGQNGRRGALMLSIDCNHPDLEEFISVKNDLNSITKANISVRIDDEFMKSVLNDREHELSFTRDETGETITKVVNAKAIFNQLCLNNWDFAEPGILFWDRIKSHNLLSNDPEFEYAGVNPCAEEPLPAGGSCLLGSINLAEFVKNGDFDFKTFEDTVAISVRALNEVLDEGLELHPLNEQKQSVGDWRQIGLGIFGLSDMLIKLGLTYGKSKSIGLCAKISDAMINKAILTSSELAKECGVYPKYKKHAILDNKFLKDNTTNEVRNHVREYGLRNSQLLTIAPTGSLSTMLGVSGGIEPIYDTHYVRKTESLHNEDVYYNVYTPIVEKYMNENNIKDVKHLPEFFVTAKTLAPKDRLLMQAIWQDRIDASISSTVNLAEDVTVEDVVDLYTNAWMLGLKGLTIFRENCARLGVLSSAPKEEEEKKTQDMSIQELIKDLDTKCYEDIVTKTNPILDILGSKHVKKEIQLDSIKPLTRDELGDELQGTSYVRHTACGKMYITINRTSDNKLVEVFIDPGKSGGCSANAEALGRYASACMRSGMAIESIIDVTKNVKCSACTKIKGGGVKRIDGNSCGDILARTIQTEYDKYRTSNKMIKDMDINTYDGHTSIVTLPYVVPKMIDNKYKCPECGNEITNQGGCTICLNCGHSKCD